MAFEALGYSADLDNEMVREFHDDALLIRGLFHLATADIGHYNLTYDGYLEWVMSYIEMWLEPVSAEESSLTRLSRYVDQQVYVALTEPRSDIGIVVRAFESTAESISLGSSTSVYWNLLIGPSLFRGVSRSGNVAAGMSNQFENLASEYIRYHLSDPSNKPDFAAYLVEQEFAQYFQPRSVRSDPTPTATETTRSNDAGPPQRGNRVYESSLSDWREADYDVGWTQPSATSLHIGVYGGDGEHIVEAWTDRADFADISASVEVREVSDHASAAGCISVRHDVDSGDYSFCILGNGRSWAAHHYVDASGEWQIEVLLSDQVRNGTRQSNQWNTIEIIAQDNRLWFVANNTVLGSVTHNARSVGAVALSVTNWDADRDAEFEFKNLVVRSLR